MLTMSLEHDCKNGSIKGHAEYMWKKHVEATRKARKDENGQDIIEYGSHNRMIIE